MRPFPLFSPSPSASSASSLDLVFREDEQAALTRFLQALVRTPSPSTQEGDVAQLVQAELHAVGVEDVSVDPVGNVIARLGDGDGPTLLYDAHMDTVVATDAEWPYDPYAAQIVDGVLYGLGACDMKGSLAAMVYAAGRLVEAQIPLHGNLVLAFVVQEEPCEGCALKALAEESGIRPDWVLLGEPSDLDVMCGHRGRVLFKVTTRGKSSHSSSPELGENAITAAARLIFGIDLLAADLGTDPFLGPGTIAVTHIESRAASTNAIPDACVFYVDRRLTLGETPTRAQAQIEAVIEREGPEAQVEVIEYQATSYTGYQIRAREAFNAWALEEGHPLVQATGAAAQAVLGRAPRLGHWSFSTDGVYSMAEATIPTVGFGPGDPRCIHTCQEHIHLDDVARAAQVYAVLAAMLLGEA
jgi:putative selenium metabolism hydrolase